MQRKLVVVGHGSISVGPMRLFQPERRHAGRLGWNTMVRDGREGVGLYFKW